MQARLIFRLGPSHSIHRASNRPDVVVLSRSFSSVINSSPSPVHPRRIGPPSASISSISQSRLYQQSSRGRTAVETQNMGKKEDKAKAQSLKTPKYVTGSPFAFWLRTVDLRGRQHGRIARHSKTARISVKQPSGQELTIPGARGIGWDLTWFYGTASSRPSLKSSNATEQPLWTRQ